ncbi:MAG: hypothetical protein KDN22_02925 [Verrucomicrobiae bacterium]|nr:hypothetical protein [Verrucomicrobiae bacterium]
MDTKTTDQNKSKNLLTVTAELIGVICLSLLFLSLAAMGFGLFAMPFVLMTGNPDMVDAFQAHAQGY